MIRKLLHVSRKIERHTIYFLTIKTYFKHANKTINLPTETLIALANINAVFSRSSDVILMNGIRIFLSFAKMKQKKQMNLLDTYILP
jgi:hypothetical protein